MPGEWYPCYVWTVMWKAESGGRPRIVMFRVPNKLMHELEEQMNDHPFCEKL
jgi:hypothetical protein